MSLQETNTGLRAHVTRLTKYRPLRLRLFMHLLYLRIECVSLASQNQTLCPKEENRFLFLLSFVMEKLL